MVLSKNLPLYFLMGLLLLFCSGGEPRVNSGKSIFDGKKFHNSDPQIRVPGLVDLIKWQSSRLISRLPSLNPNDYIIETTPNNGEILRKNNSDFSITWIGHATVLIQIDGLNILTDPIWSQRCSPVSFAGPKRYTEPGINIENLPKINAVVISHNHYDHMDLPTLKELEKRFKPTFFVGLKNRDFLKREGLGKVIEMDWWDTFNLDSIQIIFTPTQHTSARGVFDRDSTLWGSYVLLGKKKSIYFAGDTGYFSDFKIIGNKYKEIDYAILPIGAYEPRWFMKPVHMNPNDSIQAFLDLGSKYFIPIHYHTFVLTDEALDEPLKETQKLFSKISDPQKNLLILKIGESHFASQK